MVSISFRIAVHLKETLSNLRENIMTVAIAGVTILGCVYYFVGQSSTIPDETTRLSRGLIEQYVRITGQVSPSNDASLAFQLSGVIQSVGVKIGDVVPQGKVLANLSSSDAEAAILQAEANLENAQSVMGQLIQGARPEELAIKQQTLDNAENALDQVYITIPDVIRNVDQTVADTIKSSLSPLFVYAGGRYILSFSSCDQRLQSVVETKRSDIENTVSDFQKQSSVISIISSRENINKAFEQAYQLTLVTNDFTNSITSLLSAPCSTENTSLNAYRTTLSSVRATMSSLFADISSKRTTLTTAKNVYNQAERDLALTKAGTDPYRLQGQRALVKQAEAQVASARSGFEKTKIISPFAGTISEVSIAKGETVTSGKSVISMLTTNAYQVEAKIPEIDVIKIRVGSKVAITLDAYGTGVVFPATVTRINPTAITEGNVPLYKVLVTFVGEDARIRGGMTANVKIETENKTEALVLPARFIKVTDDTKGTVIVRVGKVDSTKEVTLGIRGESGLLEITGGINEGDIIVAPTTDARGAQKQTN